MSSLNKSLTKLCNLTLKNFVTLSKDSFKPRGQHLTFSFMFIVEQIYDQLLFQP